MNKTTVSIILVITTLLFFFLHLASIILPLNFSITFFFFVSCWFNFVQTPAGFYKKLKEYFKKEDFLIMVRINGIVLATAVSYKLKNKFITRFGKNELVIERAELDLFLQENLSNQELTELEIKKKTDSDAFLEKNAMKLNDNFLSQKDKVFHISYYDKTNKLIIKTKERNKIFTEKDIISFRSFIKENISKGDRVMEHHFKKWAQTLSK